jgi:hypothetical protein
MAIGGGHGNAAPLHEDTVLTSGAPGPVASRKARRGAPKPKRQFTVRTMSKLPAVAPKRPIGRRAIAIRHTARGKQTQQNENRARFPAPCRLPVGVVRLPALATASAAVATTATAAATTSTATATASAATTATGATTHAATATAATASALTRFVDANATTVQLSAVHLFDGRSQVRAVAQGHEPKATRTTGLAIGDHSCFQHLTKTLECARKLRVRRVPTQPTYE